MSCKKKQELEGNYKVLEGKWKYQFTVVSYQDAMWDYHIDTVNSSSIYYMEFFHKGNLNYLSNDEIVHEHCIIDGITKEDNLDIIYSISTKKGHLNFVLSNNQYLISQSFPFNYFEPDFSVSGKNISYNNYFVKIN